MGRSAAQVRRTPVIGVLLAACWLAAAAPALPRQDAPAAGRPAPNAELVSFPSGAVTLKGWLYRPEGNGPFPAVLWNHGSGRTPNGHPDLAKFYNSHGFVFFLPYRQGHGPSPGDYIVDLEQQFRRQHGAGPAARSYSVELHERSNADVAAALDWLKKQPFVDADRIAVSGVSYGGIQTLLTAEKGLGLKAAVAFSPGPKQWNNGELQQRLVDTVRRARVPIFILQAQNDYHLGPSELLGPELRRKGAPNRARVYPAFGATAEDGHAEFSSRAAAIAIWGNDVLDFLKDTGVTNSAVHAGGGPARTY